MNRAVVFWELKGKEKKQRIVTQFTSNYHYNEGYEPITLIKHGKPESDYG